MDLGIWYNLKIYKLILSSLINVINILITSNTYIIPITNNNNVQNIFIQ